MPRSLASARISSAITVTAIAIPILWIKWAFGARGFGPLDQNKARLFGRALLDRSGVPHVGTDYCRTVRRRWLSQRTALRAASAPMNQSLMAPPPPPPPPPSPPPPGMVVVGVLMESEAMLLVAVPAPLVAVTV